MDDLDLHDSVRTTVRAYGATENGVRIAHKNGTPAGSFAARLHTREAKEEHEVRLLSDGATRAVAAGDRVLEEEPDAYATCFEVDVARIRSAAAFRRMAGKAQVFVAPRNDMLRNRLTHVLEVARNSSTPKEISAKIVQKKERRDRLRDVRTGAYWLIVLTALFIVYISFGME